MIKSRIFLLVLAFSGCVIVAQAGTITYDVADPTTLSARVNPNGVWTYGCYFDGSVDPTTFQAFQSIADHHTSIVRWFGATDGTTTTGYGAPSIDFNPTSGTVNASDWGLTFAPHAFTMNAGSGPTVARWTAPEAGTVDAAATFTAMQYQSYDAYIYLHNAAGSTSKYSYASAPTSGSISTDTGTFSVSAGDTIDFVVANSAATEQLAATVAFTALPEPSTLLLVATGIMGLLAYAWRKRK